jgi:hypothetical protein
MKNRTVALTLAALVTSFVARDVRAAAQEKSLSVGAKGGNVAFVVGAPGPITVRVTAPSAVRARLLGPKGEVATKGPGTSLELVTQVTDADVALGKTWAVAIAPEGMTKGITAQVKIDAPGAAIAPQDVIAHLDTATRAAPKVPQGLPAPTPLMPDGVSIARIVASKIASSKINSSVASGKIVRSSPTVPAFVPRLPATAPGKPIMANNNNYGGIAAEPPTGRTFVPIVSVEVTDDDASHTCAKDCLIKAGDILTFTLGPGIDTIGHEVHFVFFEPEHDYAVSVLEWKDDVKKLSVQMPHFGPEVFDKLGAIYIGTASGRASSVFWGFKYDPTITLFLPMDAKLFPAPAKVFATTTTDSPEYSFAGPIDNRTRWVSIRGAAASATSKDTFFAGVTLKNGWTVKRAESQGWSSTVIPTFQANHTVVDVKPGTNTPTFSIDWSYDAATTLYYSVGLKVQGRDGTLPF